MLTGERRDEIADILATIARDGLPGPRDLDVALDAISSCMKSTYEDNMVWRDVTNLEAQEREWKARIASLEEALNGIASLADAADYADEDAVLATLQRVELRAIMALEPDEKPYTPCHLTENG